MLLSNEEPQTFAERSVKYSSIQFPEWKTSLVLIQEARIRLGALPLPP